MSANDPSDFIVELFIDNWQTRYIRAEGTIYRLVEIDKPAHWQVYEFHASVKDQVRYYRLEPVTEAQELLDACAWLLDNRRLANVRFGAHATYPFHYVYTTQPAAFTL